MIAVILSPDLIGKPDDGGQMANLHTRQDASYRFRWLGSQPIPNPFDLRRSGWTLIETGDASGECIHVTSAGRPDSVDWHQACAIPNEVRRLTLVVGAASAQESVRLLQAGFGEAVKDGIETGEFEARAARLAELTRWLPRHRRVDDLELDLLAREAYGHGKSLNLNPREFALIWRLADTPGEPVSKQDLIQDVWRMGFVPETNSIAVHMSRLRRKLGFVGMSGMIATASAGGYCLVSPERRAGPARAVSPRGPAYCEPLPAIF